MPIDWDSLVLEPLMGVFGEPVVYWPVAGAAFPIAAVFDVGFKSLELLGAGDPGLSTSNPVLGVRMAEFPAGAPPVQNDQVQVQSNGVTYVVMNVEPDGKGGAKLELNVAKVQRP